jgi:hypothetical protein
VSGLRSTDVFNETRVVLLEEPIPMTSIRARSVLAVGLLLFANRSRLAHATIYNLDDFKWPQPPVEVRIGDEPGDHPNNTPYKMQASGVVGGERDILVEVLGDPGPETASFSLGASPGYFKEGVFEVSTTGSLSTRVTIQYDGIDADDGGMTNAEGLWHGVSRWSMFRVDFYRSAGITGFTVEMTGAGGEWARGGGGRMYNMSDRLVAIVSPPISQFEQSPGFATAPITSYTFHFGTDGSPGSDFQLANLRIIPEPHSWVLLFGGCLGATMLVRRQRRFGH